MLLRDPVICFLINISRYFVFHVTMKTTLKCSWQRFKVTYGVISGCLFFQSLHLVLFRQPSALCSVPFNRPIRVELLFCWRICNSIFQTFLVRNGTVVKRSYQFIYANLFLFYFLIYLRKFVSILFSNLLTHFFVFG